uniref:acyltransferase family protein n=1 Tax=Caballeronia sp. LjRoot34 TaxID=3342325 RepID=UPI003F4F4F26
MSTTTSQSGGVLPALTSIRFLAALTVVLSHFTELGLLNAPKWFFDFVDGGPPAVSLFFVLSGFILTYTYRKTIGTDGPARFYVARFARSIRSCFCHWVCRRSSPLICLMAAIHRSCSIGTR